MLIRHLPAKLICDHHRDPETQVHRLEVGRCCDLVWPGDQATRAGVWLGFLRNKPKIRVSILERHACEVLPRVKIVVRTENPYLLKSCPDRDMIYY